MAEQRLHSLLDALDGRTRSLLERLARERESRRHAEAVQGELAQRLAELERRLAEAEATRLELVEECRELDEQNGELEAHNRHLHERLAGAEPAEGGFRLGRRSQGLSALIGRRPTAASEQSSTAPAAAEDVADSSSASATSCGAPEGPRILGDQEAASQETKESPAVSQSDGEAEPDVGARSSGNQAADPDADTQAAAAPADALAQPAEAPSPQALLEAWYHRYPAAFFKGHTRPLMVGIHEVLARHEPWPEKLVRRALACYVNLPRYLKAVRDGAERIDLEGNPAGTVDAQSADHAHRKLDRLQGEKRAGQGATRKASGKGGQNSGKGSKGRGQPAKAAASMKDKPKSRSTGKPSEKGQGEGGRPAPGKLAPERGEPAPVSMEEKLSALMAKHNGR